MKRNNILKGFNFTLVEVLIAVLIVSVSVFGIYSCLMFAKSNVLNSRLRLEAQRFSYDELHRILRNSREQNDAEFGEGAQVKTMSIGNCAGYEISSKSLTTEDHLDLTPDLRDYSAVIQYARSTIFDDGLKGYRWEVMVMWTFDGRSLSYSSTAYKYND